MFAERTGVSKSTIANYERGDRTPDATMLERYREAWSIDLNWLVTGEGEMFLTPDYALPGPVQGFLDARRRKDPRNRAAKSISVPGSPSGHDQPSFVRLPVFSEVQASAGPGAVPASEQVNNVIAFDRNFLRDRGGNPDRCSIIFARGTSMKPTIPDGAILVVDHSQCDVAHGCIYVFNVSDQLLVKRARWRMDGRLELVSDNTAEGYPVETFGPDDTHELRVVGRVVYLCRTP
nr:S24 family peptidase [Fuscovulum blasticum]